LLLRILRNLPITSIPSFARACRRFKVLVYDDELWEHHLKTMGVRIKSDNKIDLKSKSLDDIFMNSEKQYFEKIAKQTLKTLSMIPGLPLDPFLSQKSWKTSTGIAKDTFKRIYIELIPYYFEFRNRRKDSRLFKEFIDPTQQAKMLKRLTMFGKLNISIDSDQINNALVTTIEYFENSSLHNFELAYDANNIIEMKKWANILIYLNGGASCIQVFIQKNRIFFDYTFDALDNFTSTTSSSYSYSYGGELTFKPMSEFFSHVEDELVKQASLITQIFPPEADVFHSFAERVIEDVVIEYIYTLLEEAHNLDVFIYLKTTTIAHLNCIHVAEVLWKNAKPGLDKIRAEDMLYQMFEPLMNQYLSEEFITVKTLSEEEIYKWNRKLLDNTTLEQQSFLNNSNRELSTPRSSSTSSSRNSSILNNTPLDKRNSVTSLQSTTTTTTTSPTTSSSSSFHRKNNSSVDTQISVSSWNIKSDKLQQLLSLETALQIIHINKDSIRRIGIFVGYPDKMETIENVFILLLRILGTKHIKPGFDTAIKHLGDHKSDSETSSQSLAPFVEFFELVHIADLIQQMVQVYYDEEMEKKAFEKILDESVASGLNKGIQVLIDHVEYILATVQRPEDFRPPIDVPLDLKPTKACVEAVECLSTHVKLVIGCSDKQTLDVFLQEIGLRLFG
ncbi:2625_t:CDS:10, partial [Diversispora eburnea]